MLRTTCDAGLLGSFTGFGNSFHGQGGQGTRVSQLRYSLRLLLSMSNTGDEALLQDLHEQGAIPALIGKGDPYSSSPTCYLSQAL